MQYKKLKYLRAMLLDKLSQPIQKCHSFFLCADWVYLQERKKGRLMMLVLAVAETIQVGTYKSLLSRSKVFTDFSYSPMVVIPNPHEYWVSTESF